MNTTTNEEDLNRDLDMMIATLEDCLAVLSQLDAGAPKADTHAKELRTMTTPAAQAALVLLDGVRAIDRFQRNELRDALTDAEALDVDGAMLSVGALDVHDLLSLVAEAALEAVDEDCFIAAPVTSEHDLRARYTR